MFQFLQIIIARLTSSSLYPFHQCFFSSMPSTGLHTSTSGNDCWYIYLKLQFSAYLQNNHMIILWHLVSINSPKIPTSIAFQSQPVAFVVQSLLYLLLSLVKPTLYCRFPLDLQTQKWWLNCIYIYYYYDSRLIAIPEKEGIKSNVPPLKSCFDFVNTRCFYNSFMIRYWFRLLFTNNALWPFQFRKLEIGKFKIKTSFS